MVSFCRFMFGLWSASCSTSHLLYLGAPVRLTAETHWKRPILMHQSNKPAPQILLELGSFLLKPSVSE